MIKLFSHICFDRFAECVGVDEIYPLGSTPYRKKERASTEGTQLCFERCQVLSYHCSKAGMEEEKKNLPVECLVKSNTSVFR